MRKYVTVNELLLCDAVEFTHPIPEEARGRLLLGFSVSSERAEVIVAAVNAAVAGTSRVVETDNFGGDYPNESFLLYPMSRESAERLAEAINESTGEHHPRYWKVVDAGYELEPGFEP